MLQVVTLVKMGPPLLVLTMCFVFFVHFVMYIRQICNNYPNKMVTYATVALTAFFFFG